jgi:hypothetical protein
MVATRCSNLPARRIRQAPVLKMEKLRVGAS